MATFGVGWLCRGSLGTIPALPWLGSSSRRLPRVQSSPWRNTSVAIPSRTFIPATAPILPRHGPAQPSPAPQVELSCPGAVLGSPEVPQVGARHQALGAGEGAALPEFLALPQPVPGFPWSVTTNQGAACGRECGVNTLQNPPGICLKSCLCFSSPSWEYKTRKPAPTTAMAI